MDVFYKSTRNSDLKITASQAILKGLSDDGGLFVPTMMPKLDKSLTELSKLDYKGVAYEVMKLFLSDYTEQELKSCIEKAYDDKFDTKEIAPLVYADGAYYLELFHGATIAFKDMALSILPHLMSVAAKKNNVKEDIVILTATSGDTGKAALAGFADVPGTHIIVFYPNGGVSNVQRLQMVTQKGKNTHVVAVEGNFDDAQTGVKEIFNDKALEKELAEKGYRFSSANSINIGRLMPQVAYYVYAYGKLLSTGKIKEGDKINITVPTGNFGNILAAYFAEKIGVPVNKFICASNENKVLCDFFATGTYDRNREFKLTSSPSMDILISSNLERLIYRVAGEDADKTKELMDELKNKGSYTVTPEMKRELSCIYSGYADEAGTSEAIKRVYDAAGYVIDTHTAVAAEVYHNYKKETGDATPAVIASTASPYKFAKAVVSSIDKNLIIKNNEEIDDFEIIDELNKISNVKIPRAVEEIRHAEVLHKTVCGKDEMKSVVKSILGI